MVRSGILVLAEHDNNELKKSTENTIAAAKQLTGEVTVLIAGTPSEAVVSAATALMGVSRVWVCHASCFEQGLSENIAELIKLKGKDFSYILAPATTYGKNILPRAAALLGVAQLSDIIQILGPDLFVRPIYAGNAVETVQSLDPIRVLTIRTTAFTSLGQTAPLAPVEYLSETVDLKLSQFVAKEATASLRPELTGARRVVAGGRGLKSRENFKLLEILADQLGAALGASRAAVDAGFVTNDFQVGQTGKVVAPELYIAIGISGAIQHIAGMKDSQIIVAINQDPNAPIFQIADYGLVGDLFQILPELTQELAIQMGKS